MVIVTFRKIYNFHKLSETDAKSIIYEELIPLCESFNIRLSFYGNHGSEESYETIDEYEKYKNNKTLFNVSKIQQAYCCISENLRLTRNMKYKLSLQSIKYVMEAHLKKFDFISPGDLIIAMLVKGYSAKFCYTNLYCYFDAYYRDDDLDEMINNSKYEYHSNLFNILK